MVSYTSPEFQHDVQRTRALPLPILVGGAFAPPFVMSAGMLWLAPLVINRWLGSSLPVPLAFTVKGMTITWSHLLAVGVLPALLGMVCARIATAQGRHPALSDPAPRQFATKSDRG
ncbi:hypothetical protein [Azospirillum sp. sgz302134]